MEEDSKDGQLRNLESRDVKYYKISQALPESDGKILMVHAAGYAVGSRVIQPSQVVIGKFEETPPEA